MKSIFRYTVPHGDPVKLWLGGDPLHVAVSGEYGDPVHGVEFWAEVDQPHAMGAFRGRTRGRTFVVVGTGHPIPDTAKYWGTAPRSPEGLVWHLYELDPKRYRAGAGNAARIQVTT